LFLSTSKWKKSLSKFSAAIQLLITRSLTTRPASSPP
jgi:hypothetical protein